MTTIVRESESTGAFRSGAGLLKEEPGALTSFILKNNRFINKTTMNVS